MIRSVLPDLGRRVQVMGVLNVTPDSFSDGGVYLDHGKAIEHAFLLMDAGADILDVGGETTKPGSESVPLEVELGRVMPVIEELTKRGVGPLSIDTTKAEVARRAVAAGAKVINDVSGCTFDPQMRAVAAETRAGLILVHARARPSEMQRGSWTYEGGVVAAVRAALAARVEEVVQAGVSRDAIAIDPGIGFGKTVDENLDLLAHLEELKSLGFPLLIGTSRKSFIGQLTHRGVTEREFGTAATVALAVASGVDIVRVHDVAAMTDVVRVAEAVARRARSSRRE